MVLVVCLVTNLSGVTLTGHELVTAAWLILVTQQLQLLNYSALFYSVFDSVILFAQQDQLLLVSNIYSCLLHLYNIGTMYNVLYIYGLICKMLTYQGQLFSYIEMILFFFPHFSDPK